MLICSVSSVESLYLCMFNAGKKLNYVCKTNKKLAMSRVVLKSKEQPASTEPSPSVAENTNEQQ